jgi:hypothetical protein
VQAPAGAQDPPGSPGARSRGARFARDAREAISRRPTLAVAVAAAIIVIAGLGAFALTRGDSSESGEGGQAPAIGSTDPTTPTGTVRAHWEALGVGDYAAAHAQLSRQFREDNPGDEWTAARREEVPAINLLQVRLLRALDDENAEVAVELIRRDTAAGDEAGECVRFDGRVRVVRQDDVWRYWANGPDDSFERRGTLPQTDPRCEPLL